MKKSIYILLLVGLLGGCATPKENPQLLIRVVSGKTVEVVKHAVVTIYDDRTKWLQHRDETAIGLTNALGEIQFNDLLPTIYYVEVNYVDPHQTTLTNYPLGVYATSMLKEGERAILSVGIFDDDLVLENQSVPQIE